MIVETKAWHEVHPPHGAGPAPIATRRLGCVGYREAGELHRALVP